MLAVQSKRLGCYASGGWRSPASQQLGPLRGRSTQQPGITTGPPGKPPATPRSTPACAAVNSRRWQGPSDRLQLRCSSSLLGTASNGGMAVVAEGAGATVGIVVVDHGSRRTESNLMLDEFVELYRSVSEWPIVEAAHMELASPTIAEAIARCIEQGATRVVVAPYFLSRGRHIQEDIPALVAEAQRQHPSVPCEVADPIGIDALVAEVISNRVSAVLAKGAPASS